MRRRRITKADLENRVSELMAENKYLLSMFEMTARRLDVYKKKETEVYEEHRKNGTGPFAPWDFLAFTGTNKKKHHDSTF
jgi:hypothetical protein